MKNHITKTLIGVISAFCCLIALTAQTILGHGSGYIAAANTYDAAVQTHSESISRTNDAAVTARHLLWKKGAGDTTVALNGAANVPLGTIDNTETATGTIQAILLLGKGATKKVVASEAIAVGDEIWTAANGKVQNRTATAGTYWAIGIALTACAADGDIIEINDTAPTKVVIA